MQSMVISGSLYVANIFLQLSRSLNMGCLELITSRNDVFYTVVVTTLVSRGV